MATVDKKRYNKMENALQYINKNFVTVSDEDAKKTNPILKQVLTTITDAMKGVSPLFANLFESFLFGGSYYDGLKVGKPDEFDLDLRLVLPKLVDAKLGISNQPGFVTVTMPGWSKFEASSEFAKLKDLAKFKDGDNYLVQDKVLQWMEGVVNMALNKIGKVGNRAEIPINGKKAYVALKKSGPALTALITYDNIHLDVDLVVVFKMTADQWPPSPFKPLPKECGSKKEFLIVPKPPKTDVGKKERYWRLSFQEQERVLIMGNNTCKPALRLLKKLRDTQNHTQISSYFIKTVFLHEIDKQDKAFWNSSLSFVFMHMLKTYRDYLASYKIPYYWNKNNNMLQNIHKTTIDNFKNYLTRVIDSVDKKVDENPYILGEYLATPEEQEQLKKNVRIV